MKSTILPINGFKSTIYNWMSKMTLVSSKICGTERGAGTGTLPACGGIRDSAELPPKDDLTKRLIRQAIDSPNTVSKSGPPELRKALFLVMDSLLKTMLQDDPVYQFMDKKRAESKRDRYGVSYQADSP